MFRSRLHRSPGQRCSRVSSSDPRAHCGKLTQANAHDRLAKNGVREAGATDGRDEGRPSRDRQRVCHTALLRPAASSLTIAPAATLSSTPSFQNRTCETRPSCCTGSRCAALSFFLCDGIAHSMRTGSRACWRSASLQAWLWWHTLATRWVATCAAA